MIALRIEYVKANIIPACSLALSLSFFHPVSAQKCVLARAILITGERFSKGLALTPGKPLPDSSSYRPAHKAILRRYSFLVTPSSERVNYLITLENVEQSIIKQTMALNRVKHLRLSV